MSYLFHNNFLLQSPLAERLYHEHAETLPIIDYHNHLSPKEMAEGQNFRSITAIWLDGDHYKWRAMRNLGVEEQYITGKASDEEKFKKWAEVVPQTLRNPLFHWTHLELKNPFGITEYLNPKSAARIYKRTGELLQQQKFTPLGLLEHYKVRMLGTTDDPCDSLEYHARLNTAKVEIRPSFRPDRVLDLTKGNAFRAYIQKLSEVSGISITNLDSLLEALKQRVDFFADMNCGVSDHSLSLVPLKGSFTAREIDAAFQEVLAGGDRKAEKYQEAYQYLVLEALCEMYFEKGWVQQFHIGALRNSNTRKLKELGPDTGFDSIGEIAPAYNVSAFLNELEKKKKLTKTILYNLNPADNAKFATMVGNFQGEGIRGKVQYGAAWWFLDQLDGMKSQLETLSNMGLLSTFVGMLTDSRSFLSYSRHEYFRRLLCNMFAEDINHGLLPSDEAWIGKIIADVCYYNAKEYFGVE